MHSSIRYALLVFQVVAAIIVAGLVSSRARNVLDTITDDMGGGVGIRIYIYVLVGVTLLVIGALLASQVFAPRSWSSSLVTELTVMLVIGSSWLSAAALLTAWEYFFFWDVGGRCPGAPYSNPEQGGCRALLRAAVAFSFLNGFACWVLGSLDIHLGRMSVINSKRKKVWVRPAKEAWGAEKEKEWLKMGHNNSNQA